MKFEISFRDIVEGNSEEEVYEDLLRYLAECVKNQDVSVFNYEYIGDVEEAKMDKEFFNRITNNLLGETNA
jgi:hypothetical protein